MRTIRTVFPALMLTFISIGVGGYFWDQLPPQVPIHFDWQGQVDAVAPKPVGVFFLPAVAFIIIAFMGAFARSDREFLREPGAQSSITLFLAAISTLFLGLQIGQILTARYPERGDMGPMILGSMGMFMILMGLAMRRLPMNRWIGFRFPWNTTRRAVWNRTHDLYYRWLLVFGVSSIIAAFIAPVPVVSLSLLFLALVIPGLLSYQYARRGRESQGRRRHRGRRRGSPPPPA